MTRALDENLRRTAVQVVIPEEHLVLLEVTARHHGLHRQTEALLTEVHHRFVGWPQALEDLHRRATGDFFHHDRHPRGAESLAVFSELYAKIVREATPPSVSLSALRRWLAFLEKVVSDASDRRLRNAGVVARAFDPLRTLLDADPERAALASPALRRLTRTLHDASSEAAPADLPPPQLGALLDTALDTLAQVLLRVYDAWLAEPDPVVWYRQVTGAPGAPLPRAFEAISHDAIARRRQWLERRPTPEGLHEIADALLVLPDQSAITRAYLDVARSLDGEGTDPYSAAQQRVDWLSRLLETESLASVHADALREITRSCARALDPASPQTGEAFLDDLLGLLSRSGAPPSPQALDLVGRLGSEVLGHEVPVWTDALIRGILRLDFHYPGFDGFTEAWGVRVNPGHLRNVRAYLTVIRTDPLRSRRLLAALVAHVKLGGTFVADTDLFQRDVSALLGAAVEPVYAEVKQFLKRMPVYFNDIGAEGELRAVSTRLDEIGGRRDPLAHFLRKQIHVESNPLLVGLVEDTARFWTDGDSRRLEEYLPPTLYRRLDIRDPIYRGLHAVFRALAAWGTEEPGTIAPCFELEPAILESRLAALTVGDEDDRDKARLLFAVHREITRKYSLDHEDLLERLSSFSGVGASRVAQLGEALEDDHSRDRALDLLLEILEHLQGRILAPGETDAREDIYLKRHIAVGIPSMYGSYREDRFEALGLSFRAESLARALLEDRIAGDDLAALDRPALTDLHRQIGWLVRALRIDGCRSHGLDSCLALLRQALEAPQVAAGEVHDIFQLFSRNIEHLVRERFLDRYEDVLRIVAGRLLDRGLLDHGPGSGREEALLYVSEPFLRDLIADTFGLQLLDGLVGRVLRRLDDARPGLAPAEPTDPAPASPDEWMVELDRGDDPRDGVMLLGNKGYMLKRLCHHGFPVPPGFILTTGLSRCRTSRPIVSDDALGQAILRRAAGLVGRGGARFGDPDRPLLLSVRGGAPLSMPGMLDSFLNVGLHPGLAATMAHRPGRGWAVWDAYRRFLQFWGMSNGLSRDLYDELMREAKVRAGVPKKARLSPEQMRDLAHGYRVLTLDHDIAITDDPARQLLDCVELVLRSWDSDTARVYRREMQIAGDWGTAVIIQAMVFGNLDRNSGTGVAMTREATSGGHRLELRGDFIVQGQGDDVVSGLVSTAPLTPHRSGGGGDPEALSHTFPAIYEALGGIAQRLILEHRLNHQEIEFTFESGDPRDLFILQTRDIVLSEKSTVATFESSPALERAHVASGIGAAGGALCGRVALNQAQIDGVRRRHPGEPVILLRPDTVPEDIPLVLEADGILTTVGGATSHAAVVAKRLGKTCVVGCRTLDVDEATGRAALAGRPLEPGSSLSISGMDGSVYLGTHPVRIARVQGPART
ncbi:MAG: hypothetical protein HKO98_15550 [Gemmatimonadetes bacterium]|nr:hypothetical protein [Gemmatimonadota bacterium]